MIRVLFVCLGNICRSPAAEAVMSHLVTEEGLDGRISCDSAGTSGYHSGHLADPRMRDAAKKRGVIITSRSRELDYPADYKDFDYIITMDNSNLENVLSLDPQGLYKDKIYPMLGFLGDSSVSEVPDPYFGGDEGFDYVLDLLDSSCRAFLDHLKKHHSFSPSQP